MCGEDYAGFNFVQDPNFGTLKTVDTVDPDDTDWQFYVGDFGGAATWDVIDGTVNVDITSSGNQTYAIQLIKHMPMLNDYNYKVTFDAYADAERNITIHPVTQIMAGQVMLRKLLPLVQNQQHIVSPLPWAMIQIRQPDWSLT